MKFDGGKYSEHTQITDNPQGIGNIEYAYHRMAKACGIDMMECRLLQEKESYHFMTRRFDRMEDGEKIHVQTLAGLAHYDRDQRHSYEEIFRIMRQMNLPYPEQEELYRRMVFNVMSRNHDDHSKNLSFLMDRQGSGNWPQHTTSATHTHRAANGRTATSCHSTANKTISRWKICKR